MRYLNMLWLAGALICGAGGQPRRAGADHPNLPAAQEPEGPSGASDAPLDEWEQLTEVSMNIGAPTSGGMFVAAIAARAATIIVTSDSGGTGGPDCRLRDAITAANTDTATGGCPAGSGVDTIELPVDAAISLTEPDNDSDGPNGLPSVTSEITIIGNGTALQRDEAGGTPDFRIFHVAADGDLLLNGLTVRNGSAQGEFPASGGGILNRGALELTNCTISGNTAGFDDLGGGGHRQRRHADGDPQHRHREHGWSGWRHRQQRHADVDGQCRHRELF